MPYDDLRDWIKTLEKHGELKRISEEVSPELEITEITDRVSKAGTQAGSGAQAGKYAPGGPALLFENVKGHPGHKVFINQFGRDLRDIRLFLSCSCTYALKTFKLNKVN